MNNLKQVLKNSPFAASLEFVEIVDLVVNLKQKYTIVYDIKTRKKIFKQFLHIIYPKIKWDKNPTIHYGGDIIYRAVHSYDNLYPSNNNEYYFSKYEEYDEKINKYPFSPFTHAENKMLLFEIFSLDYEIKNSSSETPGAITIKYGLNPDSSCIVSLYICPYYIDESFFNEEEEEDENEDEKYELDEDEKKGKKIIDFINLITKFILKFDEEMNKIKQDFENYKFNNITFIDSDKLQLEENLLKIKHVPFNIEMIVKTNCGESLIDELFTKKTKMRGKKLAKN